MPIWGNICSPLTFMLALIRECNNDDDAVLTRQSPWSYIDDRVVVVIWRHCQALLVRTCGTRQLFEAASLIGCLAIPLHHRFSVIHSHFPFCAWSSKAWSMLRRGHLQTLRHCLMMSNCVLIGAHGVNVVQSEMTPRTVRKGRI